MSPHSTTACAATYPGSWKRARIGTPHQYSAACTESRMSHEATVIVAGRRLITGSDSVFNTATSATLAPSVRPSVTAAMPAKCRSDVPGREVLVLSYDARRPIES